MPSSGSSTQRGGLRWAVLAVLVAGAVALSGVVAVPASAASAASNELVATQARDSERPVPQPAIDGAPSNPDPDRVDTARARAGAAPERRPVANKPGRRPPAGNEPAAQEPQTTTFSTTTTCTAYSSSATGTHYVCGAIRDKYEAMGGPSGPLGYPTTDELTAPDGEGRFNHFFKSATYAAGTTVTENGSIYWTPATGAHSIQNDIRAKWAQGAWESGPLGYPVTNETGTPDGQGRFNSFFKNSTYAAGTTVTANGSIYWTPATGAHALWGGIRAHYKALGFETGVLGYPVTDEGGTPDGRGRYNHFFKNSTYAAGTPVTENGSIYWTSSTGAWEVHGPIRAKWAELDYERGCQGYPVSDVTPISGGERSTFEYGTISYDSASGQTTSSCTHTPEVPSNLYVTNTSSYRPIFHATVSSHPSQEVTAEFRVKDARGTLVYTATGSGASGSEFTAQPEAGVFRVGDTYTWTVRGCDRDHPDDCSADSAPQTLILDPLLGAGDRDFLTSLDYPLGDRLTAKVNVGSGNLLVSQQNLALPGVTQDLALGQDYNSMTAAPGSSSGGAIDTGAGWRLNFGQSLRLIDQRGDAVTFYGPTGYVAEFTGNPDQTAGVTYTSPAGIDATLTKTTGGYDLTFHQSGRHLVFDNGGFLLSDADRNNNTTTVQYDTAPGEHMSSVTGTRSQSRTVTMTYTGNQRTGFSQGSGTATRTVTLGYNASNELTSVTDAAGGLTRYDYGTNHQLTRITDPAGHVTDFAYDARNRVTQVVQDPAGIAATTRFSYTDGTYGRTDVTDPNGHTTSYDIDYAHRVSRTIDANGNTQDKTWTPDAKVGTATSGSGGTTRNTYGANNGESLTETTSPLGARTTLAYPASSGLTRYLPSSSTDPSGNTSTYRYNGPGNLTSTSNAEAATASVTYNNDGTVATSTDPNNAAAGAATSYGYTDQQLTSITPPGGNTLAPTRLGYDALGRIKTVTPGAGITRSYSYDALDRVTEIDYSDATPTVSYTYDRLGNLTQRVDTTGTTTYTLDKLNRLTGKDVPGSENLAYDYDRVGNLTALRDSRGETSYAYDRVNNLLRMNESGGTTSVFAYNRDNLRTDTWGNVGTNPANPPAQFAVHIRSVFDRDQRITDITTSRASNDGTLVADLGYSYHKPDTGARTDTRYAATDRITQQATSYTYDKATRLTKAFTDNGGPTYTYSYDADGNITGGSPGTHGYNTANQLTDSGTNHDANGNLTAHTRLGSFSYNGADQITSTTPAGGTGQDVLHADATQDELVQIGNHTLVNGLVGVQSRTDTSGPTGGLLLATTYYERDPQGTLVSERGPDGTFYYAFDGLGSVIALIDTNGEVAATYTYDPYGAHHTAAGPNMAAAENNPWRYAGGYRTTSGLHHYGARYYDADLGRWTQQDPISFLTDPRNGNRYAYTGCNPVNFTDPSGRDFCTGLAIASATLGAVSFLSGGAALTATGTIAGAPAGVVLGGVSLGSGFLSLSYGIAGWVFC